MAATDLHTRQVNAPAALGLESRNDFREQAIGTLADLAEEGTLAIDFAGTAKIDSAGLGVLMLVQRKAAERRQRVLLRNLRDEFKYLLVLTKLDDLFEIESAPRR